VRLCYSSSRPFLVQAARRTSFADGSQIDALIAIGRFACDLVAALDYNLSVGPDEGLPVGHCAAMVTLAQCLFFADMLSGARRERSKVWSRVGTPVGWTLSGKTPGYSPSKLMLRCSRFGGSRNWINQKSHVPNPLASVIGGGAAVLISVTLRQITLLGSRIYR